MLQLGMLMIQVGGVYIEQIEQNKIKNKYRFAAITTATFHGQKEGSPDALA